MILLSVCFGMSNRLSDAKTPVTRQEVLEALWNAWISYFNSIPKRESIWILMSQWALETGWGQSMHCFNMGNAKSRDGDGYDFTYFACNEILHKRSAEAAQKMNPTTAKITKYRTDGTCIIWFYPDHPGCRFRAFRSLQEGAADHLALLVRRFHKAWPAVYNGDPRQFAHMLKVQGYYTADEVTYTNTLLKVFNKIAKDPKLNYDNLPILTESEKEAISNMVGMSLRKMTDPS